MDMYQKRKQRQNKKEETTNVEENQSKTNINWAIRIYAKPLANPYKY